MSLLTRKILPLIQTVLLTCMASLPVANAKHIDPNVVHPPLTGIHKNHLRNRPATIDTATTQLSGAGHFVVTYKSIPEPVPLSRIHRAIIHVTDKTGKAITNADIKLKGDMPEHGHGMATEPVITPGDNAGDYIIQGLKFQMPGWWELVLEISTSSNSDSVRFNIDL